MSPTPALNLRALIQTAIDSTNIAEPRELADHLIDTVLTASEYEDALRLCLPGYVREQLRVDRATAIDGLATITPVRSGHKNKSTRWSDTKDDTGLLKTRIHNGTSWIILGDASRGDLDSVVLEYTRRAQQNTVEANRYDKVASLFDSHSTAKAVRELPFDAVRKAMV